MKPGARPSGGVITALLRVVFLCALWLLPWAQPAAARPEVEYPVVKLRSLDKISARTTIFEAEVGSTIKFGEVYIKVQSCRKTPEMEQPEAAAFLQIWEVEPGRAAEGDSRWIFSGWMFASSPGLSSMDHPIYDVWVLDCLEARGKEHPDSADRKQGEGEVPEGEAPSSPGL